MKIDYNLQIAFHDAFYIYYIDLS